MEANHDSGSPSERFLDTETPSQFGSSDGCVQVDTAVSLPLQISDSAFKVPFSFSPNAREWGQKDFSVLDEQLGSQEPVDMDVEANGNGDMTIPFIDGDDDFAIRFGVEDETQPACDNGYLFSQNSNGFNDYGSNGNQSGVSAAVSADLGDSSVASQNDQTEWPHAIQWPHAGIQQQRGDPALTSQNEQIEWAHALEQQQRVPEPERFSDSIWAGHPPMPGARFRPRLLPDTYRQRKDSEEELMLADMNKEMEKRSGDAYPRRDGKPLRRKQPRPDGSVKLSEEIDGYRGDEPVEEVLAFIEGTDASKKNEKEPVKRTKKKSGSSVDQGNGPPKKDAENARAHLEALNLRYVPQPKPLPFVGPQPRQKKTSVTRNPRENVKTDDEKRDSSDRSASPKVDVRTENLIAKTEIEDDGDEAFAKRLQDEEYMVAKMITTAPPEKETFVTVSNKKQKPAAKGFVRMWTSSKAKRAATPPPSAPAKGSVIVKANVGRQRRNSFDYSPYYDIVNGIKEKGFQQVNVAPFVSQATVETFDSELGNGSFASMDGGESASSKLSYANVAAAVTLNRLNQDTEKPREGACREKSPVKTTPIIPPAPEPMIKDKDASDSSLKNGVSSQSTLLNVEPVQHRAAVAEKIPSKAQDVLLMPPTKAKYGYQGMDFVYAMSDEVPNHDFDVVCDQPAAECVQSPLPTENKNEVLQMLFDSCKNGDLSGNVNAQISITTSSSFTFALNRDSGPAVQYVGLNMADSDTSLNLSMFFDEEDARSIVHERMARSATMASQFVMDDDLTKMSVTKYQPGTDQCGHESSAEIAGKPIRKQVVTDEEKIRYMSEFVKQEWEQFKRGTTADNYYEPKKN